MCPTPDDRRVHSALIAKIIGKKRQETSLLGRCVIINGLVAKPELNGRTDTAVSFDDDTARYSVELDETSTRGLALMIKPCNLSLQVFSVVWLCVACFHNADTTKALFDVFFLLQTSPEQTKKMEEGADMVMKELLEDEDKAAAAVSPQKKKKKAKTGKERRQGSEEQKDSERTEAGSPKK